MWVFLVVIAAFMWAIVDVIDKHVCAKELHDSLVSTIVGGIFTFAIFIFVPLFSSVPFNLAPLDVLLAVVTGIVLRTGVVFYYMAMKRGDVSKVVPLININPLFVVILSFFLFNEYLNPFIYFGIALVLISAFILSWEKGTKFGLGKVFFIAISCGFFIAIRTLMLKYMSSQIDILALLFWMAVGQGIVSLILLSFHHPHLSKLNIQGIKHIGISVLINVFALWTFTKALYLGPASLVSTLGLLELFFVFILATAFSYFHPEIIYEKMSRSIFIQKMLSIVLMVFGLSLILRV